MGKPEVIRIVELHKFNTNRRTVGESSQAQDLAFSAARGQGLHKICRDGSSDAKVFLVKMFVNLR